MEPLEFRPKHSYQFWLMIGWFCFQFFCQTIHTNRRFLEDPSSLPNNLIILVFITAAIAFLFRVNVKRVTIEDRIIIEHYLAKPIEQEPEDFVAIAGGVIHLKDYAIDTTQFRNGKRLLRAFEKRIAAGILPLGGEAPQQPQEENNNRRGRLAFLVAPFDLHRSIHRAGQHQELHATTLSQYCGLAVDAGVLARVVLV